MLEAMYDVFPSLTKFEETHEGPDMSFVFRYHFTLAHTPLRAKTKR